MRKEISTQIAVSSLPILPSIQKTKVHQRHVQTRTILFFLFFHSKEISREKRKEKGRKGKEGEMELPVNFLVFLYPLLLFCLVYCLLWQRKHLSSSLSLSSCQCSFSRQNSCLNTFCNIFAQHCALLATSLAVLTSSSFFPSLFFCYHHTCLFSITIFPIIISFSLFFIWLFYLAFLFAFNLILAFLKKITNF